MTVPESALGTLNSTLFIPRAQNSLHGIVRAPDRRAGARAREWPGHCSPAA
jgi:hypothetical protein